MNAFNIDEAIECVKIIVDKNRCEFCDQTGGDRATFTCGHSCCSNCGTDLEYCLLCLTPPDVTKWGSSHDHQATQRAKNAVNLMKTFQQAFNVDIYKKPKLLEQLKLEKELFPGCIQAPSKYFNKRKSSNSFTNKENIKPTTFPGEHTSHVKTLAMDKSIKNVQEWLERNSEVSPEISPRIPFSDININQNVLKRRIPRRADIILERVKENFNVTPKKRKTSHSKSVSAAKSQSILDQYLKPAGKKYKNINKQFNNTAKTTFKTVAVKADNDESGIVMDDDDPIIIDDSQSQMVDKDKLACLAVIEANEKEPYESFLSASVGKVDITLKNTQSSQLHKEGIYAYGNKVPFYKKSYLIETCRQCAALCDKNSYKTFATEKSKDVSITIENTNFITTIKLSTVDPQPVFGKQSVAIQTELNSINDYVCTENIKDTENVNENVKCEAKNDSAELFSADVTCLKRKINSEAKCLDDLNETTKVIADSDSDDALNESSVIEVTAEVHQPQENMQLGILAEVGGAEVKKRCTHKGRRGRTPDSTNSSDKENYDPNVVKRLSSMKKDPKKRKRQYNFLSRI